MGNYVLKCPACQNSDASKFYYEADKAYCMTCGAETIQKNKADIDEISALKILAYDQLDELNYESADSTFARIIKKDPRNADAYWGRLMAEYVIKYEIDHRRKMVPTFGRYRRESVLENNFFKKAIEFSEGEQTRFYDEKAKELEEIRIKIEENLKTTPVYDVFIASKISKRDDLGNIVGETEDSLLAKKYFDMFSEMGLKVFFSEETLGAVVDSDAEIYSALEKSKCLLVVASSRDNLESSWVKSEWLRWLNFVDCGLKERNSLIQFLDNRSILVAGLDKCQAYFAEDDTDEDKMIESVLIASGKKAQVEINLTQKKMDELREIQENFRIEQIQRELEAKKREAEIAIKEAEIAKDRLEIEKLKCQIEEYKKSATEKQPADDGKSKSKTVICDSLFIMAETQFEVGDYANASKICERIIEEDKTYFKAYWLKLYAKNKCSCNKDFVKKMINISADKDFQNAVKYAPKEVVQEYVAVQEQIEKRQQYAKKDSSVDIAKLVVKCDAITAFEYGEKAYRAQNYEVAVMYYSHAADLGHIQAICSLGWCYENGYGVEMNVYKAVNLYQVAANKDNPLALNSLGMCYENGIGVKQSAMRALELYRRGAKLGNPLAVANMNRLRR